MPAFEDLTPEQQGWVEAMATSLAGNTNVQALLGLEGDELQAVLQEKFLELVEQDDPISFVGFSVSESEDDKDKFVSPENTVVNVEIEEGSVYLRAYRAAEFYEWVYEHGTDPISRKPIDNFYIDGGEAYTSPKGQEITAKQGWIDAMTTSLAENTYVKELFNLKGDKLSEAIREKLLSVVDEGDPISAGAFGIGEAPEGEDPYISPKSTVVNVEVDGTNIFLRAYDAASFYQWEGDHGTDPITRKPIDNFYVVGGEAYGSAKGREVAKLNKQEREAEERNETQALEVEALRRARHHARQLVDRVRNGRGFREVDVNTAMLAIMVHATARWDNPSVYTVPLAGADVSAVDFTNIDTRNIDFAGTKLTSEQVEQIIYRGKRNGHIPDFSGANLAGVDFSGLDLRKVKFNRANLEGANFTDALLYETNFADANLKDVIVNERAILNYQSYYLDRPEYFEAAKHHELVGKYPLLQAVNIGKVLYDSKRAIDQISTADKNIHLYIGRDEVTGANSYQFYLTPAEARAAGSNKIWAATIPGLAVEQSVETGTVTQSVITESMRRSWRERITPHLPAPAELADYGDGRIDQGLPTNRRR